VRGEQALDLGAHHGVTRGTSADERCPVGTLSFERTMKQLFDERPLLRVNDGAGWTHTV
jgi:hypothetical protein